MKIVIRLKSIGMQNWIGFYETIPNSLTQTNSPRVDVIKSGSRVNTKRLTFFKRFSMLNTCTVNDASPQLIEWTTKWDVVFLCNSFVLFKSMQIYALHKRTLCSGKVATKDRCIVIFSRNFIFQTNFNEMQRNGCTTEIPVSDWNVNIPMHHSLNSLHTGFAFN